MKLPKLQSQLLIPVMVLALGTIVLVILTINEDLIAAALAVEIIQNW